MEHAIGKVVELPDGRKAEVVEDSQYAECGQRCDMKTEHCFLYKCTDWERTDHKSIIYKEIKEE